MAKPKKTKVLTRTMRSVRAAKRFGDRTQGRIQAALQRVADENYRTTDLADDILGQWTDFFDALRGFSSGDDEVGKAYLITSGTQADDIVTLSDTVTGLQIEKTDLAGPVTVSGGSTTAHSIAAASYDLLHPDTDAPLVNTDEVDSVKVRLPNANVPAQKGTYRGSLTLQNTKVLAEIIVVRK